ncbi:hypothetical protein OHU11_01865 [Streptomyces sp. NBC_00257]|uniref:hypothetical protein n=1 Tax=Streptomyces TaxID=1883 RepID=UPI002250FB3C|nr:MULTISPECIES: hypothetical protein [unclassified Streptomyces]WTB59252.1 hypothetical protein OG832_42020 [Streptomyces sp. NBC_00826]WTH87876.1 hypothetical protein OIC43_01705 [Streptomyces sp. NBC_00825]MCX4870079.1 hypothetical protein [Streptomyces sp. NBC_00906]MCX4901242.1 hypothetical protein [Streptomyces sp. NBC_00892]MCX5426483.1 hypothetical protein [Streptomyces sp. NBC_00062]
MESTVVWSSAISPVFLDDAETAERLFEFGVTFSSSAVTAASQHGSGTLAAAVR